MCMNNTKNDNKNIISTFMIDSNTMDSYCDDNQ